MTVDELMQIQYYLSQGPVAKLPGAKFAYAAHRNVSKIRTAVKEAEYTFGIDKEKEKEARDAREELKLEHCSKDENNEPIIKDGRYEGLDNDTFEKAWEALAEEHKEVSEAREKFIKSDIEFEPFMVKAEHLPEGVTTEMMELIGFMVMEEENV